MDDMDEMDDLTEPDPLVLRTPSHGGSFSTRERSVSPLRLGERHVDVSNDAISPIERHLERRQHRRFGGQLRELPEKDSTGEYYDYSQPNMPSNYAIDKALFEGPPDPQMIWDDELKIRRPDWLQEDPILTSEGKWICLFDPTLEPRHERAEQQEQAYREQLQAEMEQHEEQQRNLSKQKKEIEREESAIEKEIRELQKWSKDFEAEHGLIAESESKPEPARKLPRLERQGRRRERNLPEELRMTPVSYPPEPRDVHPALRQSGGSSRSSSRHSSSGDSISGESDATVVPTEQERANERERSKRLKKEARRRERERERSGSRESVPGYHVTNGTRSGKQKDSEGRGDTATDPSGTHKSAPAAKPRILNPGAFPYLGVKFTIGGGDQSATRPQSLEPTPQEIDCMAHFQAERNKMKGQKVTEPVSRPVTPPYVREIKDHMWKLQLEKAEGKDVDVGRIIKGPSEYSSPWRYDSLVLTMLLADGGILWVTEESQRIGGQLVEQAEKDKAEEGEHSSLPLTLERSSEVEDKVLGGERAGFR